MGLGDLEDQALRKSEDEEEEDSLEVTWER